jgi:hypothetical protein
MAILLCASHTKSKLEACTEIRDNGYWNADEWANDKYFKCPKWHPARLFCCIPIWIIKVIRKTGHWLLYMVRFTFKLPRFLLCITYGVPLAIIMWFGKIFGFDMPASKTPSSPFSPAVSYGRHRILEGQERSTPIIMCWTETADTGIGSVGLRLRYEQLQYYPSPFHNALPQYKTKSVDGEVSHRGPALAFFRDRFYLAWVGKEKAHSINITQSYDGGDTWANKLTLDISSTSSPALAAFKNRLYLAWRSKPRQGSYLNIMSSADGMTWVNATRLPARAASGPALATMGSVLFVAWSDKDSHRLCVRSSQDGILFDNEVILNETTDVRPALGTDEKYLYLAWKEKRGDGLIKILRSRTGIDWHKLPASPLPAPPLNSGHPALASCGRGLIIGWANPTLHIAGKIY